MSQTKVHSHLEATANIVSGFFISMLVWIFIVSELITMGYIEVGDIGDSFIITAIFTVTSYIRSYLWRRYFNGI